MWFTDDIVIDDINWYEMLLLLMIMLIWDDVVTYDKDLPLGIPLHPLG